MFKLQFDTDNAAFADGREHEVIRILKNVMKLIEDGEPYGDVFDVNGNKVGNWYLELPEEGDEE